jgi:hypothetical protein
MKRSKKPQVSNYSKKEQEFLKALGFSTYLELLNSGDIEKISGFLDVDKEEKKIYERSEIFFLDL